MAEILVNKIINKEIKVDVFIKWLLGTNSEEQYFGEFNDVKCCRTDFLTYFLNFVHEDIPCSNKHNDTPQKPTTSKRIELKRNEKAPVKRRPNLFNEDKYDVNKSASYPFDLNVSLNESTSEISSPKVCHSSSTPKLMKVHSLNAHVSPISPLYRNHVSLSTPNNDRQSFMNRSGEKGTPVCLGDFLVNRKSSSKKKASKNILSDESSKRIKPTCLSQVKSNLGFRKSDNSFNNFENTKEVSVESLNDSRNFLAEERLKILSRRDSGGNIAVMTSKKMCSVTNLKSEVEPDVNFVTNKDELSFLVEIYVTILKNNLVLNVTSEIYFLISLLLTKHYSDGKENTSTNSCDDMPVGIDFLSDEDSCELQSVFKSVKTSLHCSDLFETIHNIVYFATKSLEAQIDVLKYYDKSTLNLLRQNRRLRIFSNSFAEKLGKIAEKKTERILEISDGNVQTNVCFNSDTDNRDNFPSESAFHTFRKQRDMFYDILRDWEKQHLISDWNFSVSLGGKIRSLFSFQSEPTTFVHFSRLFKAQLLSTCSKFEKEEGLSNMPFPASIPNIDADKLNRLNSRLVTKQCSNGINSVPRFTGHQEFYKDFIIIAANYTFNKHLCDTFVAEIVELNDTKFSFADLEDIDSRVDTSTRKSFVACLKSLRILAKFLGFVESLPYKSECTGMSEKVLTFQINLRKQVNPTFDVKKLLESSIKQNSVILTVPWLTKYLSMLDYVTVRLPYYVSINEILFGLYRNCEKVLGSKSNSSNYNASLIKFSLGWLFELTHFPDMEYFAFCTKDGVFVPKTSKSKSKTVKERKLDDLDVIDQNILYICCPFLDAIKELLSSNVLNSSVTVKHITPVTAVQSSTEVAKKKLEQQLEEAFFNGQPPSVRKTVEFVSERVASACVKHICSEIVPTFKKSALERLKDFLAVWVKEHNISSPTKEKSLKAALRSKVTHMAQSSLQALKERCEGEVINLANERVPLSVSNLLSVDVLSRTKQVCVAITTRTCLERVKQWVNTHVTVAVFTKDFNSEMQKVLSPDSKKIVKEKPVFLLPSGGNDKNHNDDATSAFHLLEKLKGLSIGIMENSLDVDEEVVGNLLNEAYTTLTERSDVNECIAMYICMILVDISLLLYFLVAHKPNAMVKEDLLKSFVRVWNCYSGKVGDLFKNLFCPRNVMLLAQSCNEVKVWETYAGFVVFLLEEHVLTAEGFEVQCTEFYQKEWDQGTLSNFTVFLRKFLNCYQNIGENNDKFTLLLEFLSDFCTDL